MPKEPLSGHVFVFTGEMSLDREEAKGKAILLGARVTTAVSSKTTHLVAGTEPGPSKLEKAKGLGVKIIDEDEFRRMLDKNSARMDSKIITSNPVQADEDESRGALEKSSARMDSRIATSNEVQDAEPGLPWTEKYRPVDVEDIVGNKAVIEQLERFVQGMTDFSAALISGAPGVGKTTTAVAVCRKYGLLPIEFNASDLRSKKKLTDVISKYVNNLTLDANMNITSCVIIMDEVDGMTSDRGGIPELVSIIKKTKIPFICICNDKTHPKMRTLASHCIDLHFRKLDARSIMPRIKFVLEQEGKQLPDGVINEIIAISNGDVRYILNKLQSLVSRPVLTLEFINRILVKKNILKGTFEIAAEMFQRKSVADKMELYFEDSSLVPLFVHENYLKCNFQSVKEMLVSADLISTSDLIDARIHGSEQEWSLMPYHAFFSSICPTSNLTLHKRLDFPLFLGQNSKFWKNNRLLSDICHHLKQRTGRKALRLFVGEVMLRRFIAELCAGNIAGAIEMLKETDLLRDDMINLGELIDPEIYKGVVGKSKTSLTREYNKLVRKLPYTVSLDQERHESGDE